MKKMSKQDVETVIFENAKTGEALEFQHEQHKAEYGAKHFWKADKKFFELLSTFSAVALQKNKKQIENRTEK